MLTAKAWKTRHKHNHQTVTQDTEPVTLPVTHDQTVTAGRICILVPDL